MTIQEMEAYILKLKAIEHPDLAVKTLLYNLEVRLAQMKKDAK